MARISMKGPGTVAEISALLKERVPESGWTCELVDCVSRGGVELLIFEKHFYRAGNFLTLTLMLSSENGQVIVDSIASGARTGALFDVTWGAEEDFAEEPFETLAPMGFTVFDKSEEFDSEYTAHDFFTAEVSEESVDDILQRAIEVKRSKEHENKSEPERVSPGREEKKGLFGRKGKKPDWEY